MTDLTLTAARLAKIERQLRLSMRLAQSSVWEFVLTDGLVENSYLDDSAICWEDGVGPPAGTDFATSMAALGVLPADRRPLAQAIQACVDGQTPEFQFELRWLGPDGAVRWRLARGTVSRDTDGTARSFTGVVIDITALKRAEDESRQHKERLELAVLGSKACTWDFELKDGTIENSRATDTNARELLGYDSAEDAAGLVEHLDALTPPEAQNAFMSLAQSFLDGRAREWNHEFRVRHKDGSDRWHLGRGVAQRDASGRATRFTGTSVDITDRKLTEQALRESEERFRATFENAAVGMLITDSDGHFVSCNDRTCEFFGVSREYLTGRGLREFMLPSEVDEYVESCKLVASGELESFTQDKRYSRGDGAVVWGSITISVIQRDTSDNASRLIGILQDISSRKSLEENLQRTKDRLELAVRSSNISIFEFDTPDGTLETRQVTLINFWEQLGYDPALMPSSFAEKAALVLTPEGLVSVPQEIARYLSGETSRFELEHEVRHRDGSSKWRLARGMAVRNEAGTAVRFIGSHVDITDKKQVEERLRESEYRWRSLAETLPLLVFTAAADGEIEYLGTQATQYTGRTEQAMLGAGWAESIHPDDLERTGNSWFEAIEKQSIHEVQHRIRRWDGEYRWFTTRAAPARDSAGRVFKWIGTCTDVTTLKQLETALQRANDRLELAMRSSNLSIFEFEMSDGTLENGQHTLINFWEQLGYDPAYAPGTLAEAAALVLTQDDFVRIPQEILRYLSGGTPRFELEHEVRHKDGSLHWRLARGTAVLNDEGAAIRFIGSQVDISKQKRVEGKLRESEQRWRSLAESVPHLVFTNEPNGMADYLSAQTLAFLGRTEDEMRGSGWADAIHPDDLERTGESWLEAIEKQHTHEVQHRIRRWDGEYFWFTTRAEPARDSEGRVFKWVGTCTDITNFKRLEAELRHAKELLELGIRGSNVAIFDFDMPDGTIENARQTMINVWETLGYDPDTVPSEFAPAAILAIHPEDLSRVQTEIGMYLAGESQKFEAEFRVRHKDGSILWRMARGTALRDVEGRPVRFLGSFFDITEQKRVEDKLRESEQHWRTLAEAVPHLVFTNEPNGMADYLSAQALEFLGRTEDEMRGSGWAEAMHPEERERVAQAWSESIAKQLPHEIQHRVRRWDGEYRWMTTRIIALRDSQGGILKWFGTSTDITTLKQLEEELRHSKDLLELGVRGSKVSIFELNMPDGNVENANQTMINLWESLGYDPATAPRKFGPGSELAIHPDDLTRVRTEVHSYLNGASQDFEVEFRVRRKDGAVLWNLARGVAFRDSEGKPMRFIGSFVDITDKKQIEEQLRESERRWRQLAEMLPEIVWTTGPDGTANYFSAWTMEYTGRAESELIGWAWGAAIHPDDAERTYKTWLDNVAKKRAHQVEHRVRRWDGEYRWFTTHAAAVWDAAGNLVGWFGITTDVENLKQLEAQLRHAKERLELAIRSANLFIWEYDMPDGTLENSRETLTNVWESFGYDVLDRPPSVASVVHTDDLARVGQQILACLSGETPAFEAELRVRHQDGSYHWILGRGVVLRDSEGRPTRFVGTGVDINDIKRIEEDLLRAREAAESANRAKDEFLANVSHEIRTPMNAILGMTELALDSARTEHQRQLLSTVRSAGRNLLNIINDLLDFSKIAAGKLALDEADFSLRTVVGDTVRALVPRAQRKGLELIHQIHSDVPDALFGDAGRLGQVLMNLIGNALKFTTQGEVVVEVTQLPSAAVGGTIPLYFSVRDTGIGIAREKQAAIFRAFEQEDASTTRKYGGTGLGLTISSQLVALMGGDITVESEPGRGSTFAFTAHFERSRFELGNGTSSTERPEGGMNLSGAVPTDTSLSATQSNEPTLAARAALRILVAEDNELNVALLRELLTQKGHSAEFARNGEAALALATAQTFDLLLLDLHMPEMDGFDVVRAIREHELVTNHHLPIVALTARSSNRDRERCLAAGMDDFLSKPIESDALWPAIERMAQAFPPPRLRQSSLLDHGAISRACAGRQTILAKLCDVFQRSLPEHLTRIRLALHERDLPRLGQAAHLLYGTLAAFSSIAGELALTLEDAAIRDDPGSCAELVERLETMCSELLVETSILAESGLRT